MNMKERLKDEKKIFGAMSLLLLIVSALAYLPWVNKIGLMNDDWYWVYDAYTQGADFLHEVWRIDRPGRTFLMIPLYHLFGEKTLGYHLTAYLFRFLSGVSLFWALRLVWREKRFFAVVATLLYTLYPGFLSQPNPVDYQSHIFALFLALLSVALTIKALLVDAKGARWLLVLGAILTGWGYLSQMEYFISFEIFRLALVVVVVFRQQGKSWLEKIKDALLGWLPFSAAPGGFLIWRLFFFEAERRSTDIGTQLGQLFSSPLVGLWWLVYLVQDILNVLLVAWGYPLYAIAYRMRLRDTLIGFVFAGLSVFLIWLVLKGVDTNEDGPNPKQGEEAVWVGLVTIIGGLLPIIMVNRHIVFPDLSRYSLIASVGVAVLLAELIARFPTKALRVAVTGFLVFVSMLTHYANGASAAKMTKEINDFWWQVSWRVPDIESGTTLIADYASIPLSEDYILWGPANFIYRPEAQNEIPIEIDVPAAVLTNDVVMKIVSGKGSESPERRGNYLTRSFDNLLFMVQTTQGSCVRIINGDAPELSSADSHRTILVSSYSQIENVRTDAEFSTPPESVFGTEPQKKWCYYYQKASLSRQQGEWGEVIRLTEKALDEGFYPTDSIEWMPLLEAYAQTGNIDKMRPYVSIIRSEPFLSLQACSILTNAAQTDEMETYINNKFCE